MFIIGGLILAQTFQKRHPDFHANACIAFFCFAVVVIIVLITIVSYSVVLSDLTLCSYVYGNNCAYVLC